MIYVPQLPQFRGPNGSGSWPSSFKKVWNRSGAATIAGGLFKLDLHMTTTSTSEVTAAGRVLPAVTSLNEGNWDVAPESAYNNLIAIPNVSSELTEGIYVVAMEAKADNELLEVCEYGLITITNLSVGTFTNSGTVTVPAHSLIIPLVNSVRGALSSGGSTTDSSANPTLGTGTGYLQKILGVTVAATTFAVASGTPATYSPTIFFNGKGMLP